MGRCTQIPASPQNIVNLGVGLLDLIYPKQCVNCGVSGAYICAQCGDSLQPARQKCPGCSYYSFSGKTHSGCAHKTSFMQHYSLYKYEGAVRKALWALKYRFASDLAKEIGALIAGNVGPKNLVAEGNFVLVPIPLHIRRERWRGFNQAELLGEGVAKVLKAEFAPGALLRLKHTKSQVGLGRDERLRNISGKYAVNKGKSGYLAGKNAILFDDVWTTGATMNEAGRVLKRTKVRSLTALSVAS